jgi:hypothetical protein
MRTYEFLRPSGVRPSASIAFSTLRKRPAGWRGQLSALTTIERLAEDRYQISLAVAGFAPDDYRDHG